MRRRFGFLCRLAAVTLVVSCLGFYLATAQDASSSSERAVPRFVVMPPKPAPAGSQLPASNLQTWSGSFTHNGTNFPFVMVGQDPSTGQSSVITTFIIPVKIVLSTGQSFDPLSGGPLGPLASTITSPIFDATTTYTQGGTNVGTTQYVDAFQRANFWSIVQNEPNYHVL